LLGDAWAPERSTAREPSESPNPETAAAPVRASRPFSLDASSPPLRRALPGPRSVAWAARAMQATMRRAFIGAAEPVGRPEPPTLGVGEDRQRVPFGQRVGGDDDLRAEAPGASDGRLEVACLDEELHHRLALGRRGPDPSLDPLLAGGDLPVAQGVAPMDPP